MDQNAGKRMDVYLELSDICKNFGITKAINHSDFVVRLGMITGLTKIVVKAKKIY